MRRLPDLNLTAPRLPEVSRAALRAPALLLATLGLAAGCAHSPRDTSHLFPADFTPMGHRGAAGLAPENTMAAFAAAAELGVGFELDTMFVGSGELVVFHDDELERLTDATGAVADVTLAELQALDVGSRFSPEFAGEAAPTLGAVLDAYGGEVLINIEVKAGKGADAGVLAQAVVAEIRARGLEDQVLVTSFNPFVLEQVKLAAPELMRGQIYGTFKGSGLKGYEKILLRNLAFNRRADPDALMVEHAMVDRRYLRKMHRRGYRVFTWTVNDPERMRELKALGVDGVLTDRPDLLLEVD